LQRLKIIPQLGKPLESPRGARGGYKIITVFISIRSSHFNEKNFLVIAAIGKIMFAQVNKLENSVILKFSCIIKLIHERRLGLDTSCAAYVSKLQYLVGPVTTHFQSAKVHNQPITSLDFLISSRKTLKAIGILRMLCDIHISSFLRGMNALI
ncbi:phenylalanine ammonia-lyase, partial [Puccinia sorghi]